MKKRAIGYYAKNLSSFKPQMTALATTYKYIVHKQIDGSGKTGRKTACWKIGSNIAQDTAMQSSFHAFFER